MEKSRSRRIATLLGIGLGGLSVVAGSGLLLGGCNQGTLNSLRSETSKEQQNQVRQAAAREQAARQRGWSEGHQATVACLHGERAQTDGNELLCEDSAYVAKNYR